MAKKHYKLSVLVPSIRANNLKRLYDSVGSSFSEDFEFVVISPYDLPYQLADVKNILHIRSWKSPNTCQQVGLFNCSGEFFTWAADDGFFLPGALDHAFYLLGNQDPKRFLVMGKYVEGNGNTDEMHGDDYYILSKHEASRCRHIRKGYYMLNVGIVQTKLVKDIGGYDLRFESCPMAFNDLSVRLQNKGVEYIIQDELMFSCSHMPGTKGDHSPIHYAMIENDMPLFCQIYNSNEGKGRISIPLDQKIEDGKWSRRFR